MIQRTDRCDFSVSENINSVEMLLSFELYPIFLVCGREKIVCHKIEELKCILP